MNKIILFASPFLLLLGSFSASQSQDKTNPVNRLMTEKLQSSQKLLEGLAIGDFNKISANAEKLIQLSNTEEWLILKSPRYEMHSNEFRRAVESLSQKAKSKNLDGCTVAFFETTLACVRCHQYVREVRDARLPQPPDYIAVLKRRQ